MTCTMYIDPNCLKGYNARHCSVATCVFANLFYTKIASDADSKVMVFICILNDSNGGYRRYSTVNHHYDIIHYPTPS